MPTANPLNAINRQASYRRDLNPLDQFGRKWLVVVEKETMDVCGEALPAWPGAKDRPRDPLRTPMNYVALVRNEDGQADTMHCWVDFDAWIEQQRTATEIWYENLHRNALQTYKAIEQDSDLEHDRILTHLTGPKPWPATEVIAAARDGDRQYLGMEPLDAEHRAALLMPTMADLKAAHASHPTVVTGNEDEPPTKYQDFVRWVQQKGLVKKGDLKAIAAMWNEHQASLTEA